MQAGLFPVNRSAAQANNKENIPQLLFPCSSRCPPNTHALNTRKCTIHQLNAQQGFKYVKVFTGFRGRKGEGINSRTIVPLTNILDTGVVLQNHLQSLASHPVTHVLLRAHMLTLQEHFVGTFAMDFQVTCKNIKCGVTILVYL